MIERHLRFLGITFFILLALVIFTESPVFKKGRTPKEIKISDEFNEESISKIKIKSENKELNLEKINGIWTVIEDSVPRTADYDRVVRLIDNMSFLKGKVVGKNEAEFPSYGVDDKNGILVQFFDNAGKKIFELIVGKQGADFGTNFVRLPGSKEVLLVEKPLKPQLGSPNPSIWRNRIITKFTEDEAVRVEYEDRNQRYMFYKENEKWILDSPEINADQQKIKRYVRMLGTIYSIGYIDTLDIKEYDAKKPFLTILVTLKDGKKQGFKVIEEFDKNRYIVKREGDDFTLYLLAKKFVENSIKKERSWFIAEEKKEEIKEKKEK